MVEKSQVKFTRNPKNGEIIGFVSRQPKTNKLMGVRENSEFRKRVCVLSNELKGCIVPGALYEVELRPMHNGKNGYVVTAATRIYFDAQVELIVKPHKEYKVVVRFGLKSIYFDPIHGKSESSRTLPGVLEVLNAREDISNADGVISDFLDRAQELLHRMKDDGYNVE